MEIAHRFIGGTIIPVVVFIPNPAVRTKIIKICGPCGRKAEDKRGKSLTNFIGFGQIAQLFLKTITINSKGNSTGMILASQIIPIIKWTCPPLQKGE